MLVSILIPFHNEAATLPVLLERASTARLPLGLDRELVLVDDGSTDGSDAIATAFASARADARVVTLPQNRGKGAAIRAGLGASSGEIVLVQDADLEWDPADWTELLAPYEDPTVAVVFGSRRRDHVGSGAYFHYYLGGRVLTAWTNLLFGSCLTDQPTGFKSFRRSVLLDFKLGADGFDFDAEITGRLLQAGHAIREVPVSYRPRTFGEGKKVRARDGVRALWTLLRIRLEGVRGDA